MPVTTRDTLEENIEVAGILLRLTDTAGIRNPENPVEKEGISRSRMAMEQADLVLLVLDGSAPWEADDDAFFQWVDPASTLVIVNKSDIMPCPEPPWKQRLRGWECTGISALTGEGMEALAGSIRKWALRDDRPLVESALITNLRQKQAALRALGAVESALAGLWQGIGDELLAVDLSNALDALGEIVGETTADDLLDRIFSEFCIGK